MAENLEKKQAEEASVELADLSQEMTAEQLQDVKGGDLKVSSKPIVKKVTIRP